MASILVVGTTASCIAIPNLFTLIQNTTLGYDPTTDGNYTINAAAASHFIVLTGLIGPVLTAASIIYRDSSFLRIFTGGYTQLNSEEYDGGDDQTLKPNTNTAPKPVYTPPPNAAPEAFNMFDPADLPPRLSEYANMVYSACEDLGNFFGFQDSSVRNQAEHLLILLSNNRRYMNSHILPPALQPPSPIHALHAKVFSNYMKWCRAMGVAPHFSKMNSSMAAPPSVASRVVDLVMFFCVWGEACNIRHMPECLWFLYHKMMEEYTSSEGYTQTRSLYAGHYLDYVVTPIYKIVCAVSNCCTSPTACTAECQS